MSLCSNGLACNLTALLPDYQSCFTDLTDMCRLCRLCKDNGNGNDNGTVMVTVMVMVTVIVMVNGSKVMVNLQDLLVGLAL